jgi:hypothetical protein
MDAIDTGLAIAPLCTVVLFAAWVVYASCKKKPELAQRLIVENEIV